MEEDVSASRAAFAMLDPLLRALLVSIERGRKHQESEGTHVTGDIRVTTYEERDLAEMRARGEIMQRLNETLAVICGRSLGDGSSASTVATGLIYMADYVLLPLTLILQEALLPPEAVGSHSRDSSEWRKYIIFRSAGYSCIEQASLCMSLYVELVSGFGGEKAVNDDPTPQIPAAYLKNEVVVRCLTTCAIAMANLDESRKPMGGLHDSPQERDRCFELAQLSDESLDKGDNCHRAILRSIESLLLSVHKQGSASEKVQADITSSLGGALLARLAEGCLSALGSNSPTVSPRVMGNRLTQTVNVRGEDIRGNVSLKLQACSSLRAMMNGIPKSMVWRTLLPGSFAVLFRESLLQLRFSTAQSSPKVAAESIRTLSDLINISLSQEANENIEEISCDHDWGHDHSENIESAVSATMALRAMVSTSNSVAGCSFSQDSRAPKSATETVFVEEVNKRLPAPLLVLMHHIAMHRSPIVRRSGAALYSSVLMQTHAVWGEESKEKLERTAMECCLALMFDSDESVCSESESALLSYQASITNTLWREKLSSCVAPRIVELIEGLPILARGLRDNELRTQIDIICGYLQININEWQGQPIRQNRKGTELGMSLARASNVIRKALGDLFRPDYDSMARSPRVAPELIISRNLADSLKYTPTKNRYFFLRESSTYTKATILLHMLGKSFGEKQGSLFVDGCIAEMFNAHQGAGPAGRRQHGHWLDQFCGQLVVTNEVLVSSFPCVDHSKADTDKQDSPLRLKESSRRRAKRAKVLHALASSVLPIITSLPIWNLPTTIQVFSEQQSNTMALLANPSKEDSAGSHNSERMTNLGKEGDETFSVSLFHGNAIMQGSLLRMIGNICQLLGNRTNNILPTILLPLLEKTGACNHYHVQQTAIEALDRVAGALGARSIASLVSRNFDYVMESLSLQLRSQMYTSRWGDITSVMSVLLQSTKECESMLEFSKTNDHTVCCRSRTALLFDFVDSLMDSFDKTERRSHHPTKNSPSVLGLIQCFRSTVHFLSASFGFKCENKGSSSLSVTEFSFRWLNILAEFEDNLQKTDSEDTIPAAIEDETNERTTSSVSEAEDLMKCEPRKEEEEQNREILKYISRGVEVTKKIVSRCCFFLSIREIKIQVASCETLLSGFEFLSYAEDFVKDIKDESDGIGNPFLSSVSDCWPSIVSRLEATCDDLMIPFSSHTLTHEGTTVSTTSNFEVLFSHLLGLVATACERAGDFMTRRFEQDVWPLLSKLLGTYVRFKNGSRTKIGQAVQNINTGCTSPVTKDTALVALLVFLSRIFMSNEFGITITPLILPLGVMALPLLSEEGQVADATVDVYKQMLARDCDTLWRTLAVTCGEGLPSRVLKPHHATYTGRQTKRDNVNQRNVAQRAKYLLEYAGELPEQFLPI